MEVLAYTYLLTNVSIFLLLMWEMFCAIVGNTITCLGLSLQEWKPCRPALFCSSGFWIRFGGEPKRYYWGGWERIVQMQSILSNFWDTYTQKIQKEIWNFRHRGILFSLEEFRQKNNNGKRLFVLLCKGFGLDKSHKIM